ncbi:hypothetical protein BC830DRAFT_1078651 [Chytriomyces sp. MP71]|nr:hypothetical protein BC830DRAFT_1078651 [Chytriomyces sp. MP71]
MTSQLHWSPNRCGSDWPSANSTCGPACAQNMDCVNLGFKCWSSLSGVSCLPPPPEPTDAAPAPAGGSSGDVMQQDAGQSRMQLLTAGSGGDANVVPGGAIAAVVCAGVMAVAAVIGVVLWVRRRGEKTQKDSVEGSKDGSITDTSGEVDSLFVNLAHAKCVISFSATFVDSLYGD